MILTSINSIQKEWSDVIFDFASPAFMHLAENLILRHGVKKKSSKREKVFDFRQLKKKEFSLVMSSCDSDVDESSVPSASECQRRIDAFVSVTETDEAFAQMTLQRHKWDLKEAMEAHFGGTGAADAEAAGEGGARAQDTRAKTVS